MTTSTLFAMIVISLLAVSEGRWWPHPPWVEPSSKCYGQYSMWLRSYEQTTVKGCLWGSLPENFTVTQVSGDTGSTCGVECFNYAHNQSWQLEGRLDLTAIFNESSATCLCSSQTFTGSEPSNDCPTPVLSIPVGCLFENPDACIKAPSDGCVWTYDHCCMDATGFTIPGIHNLIPWWAWGVGAVILLLSSLLGLVVRTRTRFSVDYTQVGSQQDELDDATIEQLKQEYEVLLKELVEADRQALAEEQGDDDGSNVTDGGEVADASIINVTDSSTTAEHPPAESNQDGSCPVCLEDLSSAECVRLRCGHRLRFLCMQQYVAHSVSRGRIPACPICRARVLTPSQENGNGEL
eukprot:TRINITY_DN2845_c7_g1_i1.p1 TRINITY_DN2845_c7_g1~~TRINITY_DN2845_c7_g1_i1.p1  ORF type:complete len:381 (+),score=51.85 TRINITY_DN2845_c7_g1_i1:92-1144(+)